MELSAAVYGWSVGTMAGSGRRYAESFEAIIVKVLEYRYSRENTKFSVLYYFFFLNIPT